MLDTHSCRCDADTVFELTGWGSLFAVLHLVATLAMTAVIWFVQMVHYPLFREVGREAFVTYEKHHVNQISWVVMPLMLVELTTACLLVAWPAPAGLSRVEAAAAGAILAAVWGSTFLLQVPLHSRLANGFDPQAIDRLVRTNWFRTIGWSARATLVLIGLWRLLSSPLAFQS